MKKLSSRKKDVIALLFILSLVGYFGCIIGGNKDNPDKPVDFSLAIIIAHADQRVNYSDDFPYSPLSLYWNFQDWTKFVKQGNAVDTPYVVASCSGFLSQLTCNLIEDTRYYTIYNPTLTDQITFVDPWNFRRDTSVVSIKQFLMLMKSRNYELIKNSQRKCVFIMNVGQRDAQIDQYASYDDMIAHTDIYFGEEFFYRDYYGGTYPCSIDQFLPVAVIYERTIDQLQVLLEKKTASMGYHDLFNWDEFGIYEFRLHVFCHEMGHVLGIVRHHGNYCIRGCNDICAMQDTFPTWSNATAERVQRDIRVHLTSVCICTDCAHNVCPIDTFSAK